MHPSPGGSIPGPILREYQDRGIDDILAAFEAGHRSVLYVLPTAGGKTVLFAEIARRAAASGTRVGILVHRDQLLIQAAEKVDACGLSYSLIAPGHNFYGDLVCIASKDTLVRRLSRHDFDLIIIDEAHRATAPTYRKIMDAYPEARILGVTATPQRTGGQGLDVVFDALVLGPSIRSLIDQGFLAEPVTYGALKLDLSGLKTVAGDYDQHALADLMDKPRITGAAISAYEKLCPGESAMAFGVGIPHCEDIAADFRAAGYRSTHVSGEMGRDEVRRRIASLKSNEIQVLVSCDIASEGIDIPSVRAGILLRPTSSLIVYLQQAGRILRPKPNGGKALILDHAGSFARFGLVDDEREWSLEGRKKRARAGDSEAAVSVRQCPKCYFCHRPAAVCPECGWVYEIAAREPDVESGELAVIDAAALRRVRQKEEREARTYRELCDLAKRRHYSLQWPLRKWIERGNDPRLAK